MSLFYYLYKFKNYITGFFKPSTIFSKSEIEFIKSKPLLFDKYKFLNISDMYSQLNTLYKTYDIYTPLDKIIKELELEIICYQLSFKLNDKYIRHDTVLKKIEIEKLKDHFLNLKELKNECENLMKILNY